MLTIGITGGIAAYKMCSVVSYFAKEGHDVRVVMTEKAKQFVGPMTFAALSGNPVIDDSTEWNANGEIDHIAYSKTKLLVIAPATANTISKIANGMADNVLTSLVLAYTGRVLIAPAMNVNMWGNSLTRENVEKLQNITFDYNLLDDDEKIFHKYKFIDPVSGILACKDKGVGKLASTETIIRTIKKYLE